ncbi:hypothetical protein CF68_08530 [Cupriavidus sp. SK-4]|nr:hypothetical protein CF68_08530 [Cupriavidus sp. SK-4]
MANIARDYAGVDDNFVSADLSQAPCIRLRAGGGNDIQAERLGVGERCEADGRRGTAYQQRLPAFGSKALLQYAPCGQIGLRQRCKLLLCQRDVVQGNDIAAQHGYLFGVALA